MEIEQHMFGRPGPNPMDLRATIDVLRIWFRAPGATRRFIRRSGAGIQMLLLLGRHGRECSTHGCIHNIAFVSQHAVGPSEWGRYGSRQSGKAY